MGIPLFYFMTFKQKLSAVIISVLALFGFGYSTGNFGSSSYTPAIEAFATSSVSYAQTSSTRIAATTTRTYYAISNNSANTVYLNCGDKPAVVRSGITLFASSTLEMSVDKGNACYGSIQAIVAGTAGTEVPLTIIGY